MSATNIYYSIGQNTSNHMTGSPTLTITSGGVGTFSVAQTATNMGIGDLVTYNTSSRAFISGKTSTSVWTLVTATGGTPSNVSNQTVNSITHCFVGLAGAVGSQDGGGSDAGAIGSSFMNTGNLVTANYILNIACYYDSGADATSVKIVADGDEFTSGASNYIYIFTPYNTSTQCNQSQRHNGTWTTTAYLLSAETNESAIECRLDYVNFDGLQVTHTTPVSGFSPIWDLLEAATTVPTYNISNCITKGWNSASDGEFCIQSQTCNLNVWNCVFYNINTTVGGNNNITGSGGTWNIYNCTMIGGQSGVFVGGGTVNVKNCYAAGNGSGQSYYNDGGTLNLTTCASSDSYGSTGLTSIAVNTTNFKNVTSGSENFGLPSTSGLKGKGTNTTGSSAPLNFTTDIVNYTYNTSAWDVGAFAYETGSWTAQRISTGLL